MPCNLGGRVKYQLAELLNSIAMTKRDPCHELGCDESLVSFLRFDGDTTGLAQRRRRFLPLTTRRPRPLAS